MSTLSPVYTQIAIDQGTYELPGPRSVAYAAVDKTGSIFYRNLSGTVNCNSGTFGDPSPGHTKACYAAVLPSDFVSRQIFDASGNPTEWKNCATENSGACNPQQSQPVDIIYGANGHYVYANALEAPCNNSIFGDPSPGHVKNCWWRASIPVGPIPPAPIPPAPIPPAPITPIGPPVSCPNVPSTPSTGGACNNVINGFNYYIRSCANIIIIIIIIIIVFIIMALLMRKAS